MEAGTDDGEIARLVADFEQVCWTLHRMECDRLQLTDELQEKGFVGRDPVAHTERGGDGGRRGSPVRLRKRKSGTSDVTVVVDPQENSSTFFPESRSQWW